MKKSALCIFTAAFYFLCGMAFSKATTFHEPMAWIVAGVSFFLGVILMLCLYFGVTEDEEGRGRHE